VQKGADVDKGKVKERKGGLEARSGIPLRKRASLVTRLTRGGERVVGGGQIRGEISSQRKRGLGKDGGKGELTLGSPKTSGELDGVSSG